MKIVIIGTFLPDSLLSLASALKFDGISPAPDTTKRKTASKLITRGSWPPVRKFNCHRIANKKHHQPKGT
jgi:hypothetical protein